MATRMYVCESVEHPSSLLMGLNEQRLQGQLCDVTVRVQGHLFKAHTNILASAMGYFRDLFLNPTKQTKKDIIEIPMIVNSIGFAKVLDFIYTSQLCLSQSSVMQVLCSACYLQIPYVVDKCQEFIVTHGHASPQNTFPAITDHRYLQNKNAENQECELINTPPSPGNQSTSTGNRDEQTVMNGSPLVGTDGSALSPGGNTGKTDNMLLIKQEHTSDAVDIYAEAESASNDPNPASTALIEFSNQNRLSSRENNSQNNGTLKMLLQNCEGGNDTDAIDHESLAMYFERKSGSVVSLGDGAITPSAVSLMLGRSQSPATSVEHHLYSMTKNLRGSPAKDVNASSPTSSVSQYLLSMKKEKPKKEYRCEYCNKMFGRQQHLKRHILTHTGERPYPCNLCEKRFRRSEHLKHHLVKHQQETNNGVAGSFIDYAGPGRKRPRKPVPSDAYGMSKMMLVSYNQQRQEDNSSQENKKLDDTSGSSPVLMPKLNSTLHTISERLAFAASQRGEQEKENGQTSGGNSPVALNLSGKDATETTLTMINNVGDEIESSPAVDETAENFEESITLQEDGLQNGLDMSASGNGEEINHSIDEELTNSEDSKASPQEENPTNNMSIDGFASSEVVTNDLKRLFAAMDE